MADLPSGAVTFLFTDIEGSTRHVKYFRERWDEILAEHQRLLRAAFAVHGGQEVDSQGDSFFVVFASARNAVLAAVAGQRALLTHRWPDEAELRVRMGLHTGQALVTDGRYTGLAVHRAARIGAAGHGGQVLVSQATQTLLDDEEEDLGIVLRDLGEQRLKDLDRPVRLYQVAADGLPSQFPPLRHRAELAPAAEAAVAARVVSRRRLMFAAAIIAVLAAATTVVIRVTGGGRSVVVRPNSVAVIDPNKGVVIDQFAVGARPGPLAAGGGAIWVANLDDRTLARVDPQTRSVVRYLTLQRTPTGLAYGEDALWVANGILGTVQRVDPRFDAVGDPIDTGAGRADTASLAVGFGAVWFVSGNSNVVRLNPNSSRIEATLFSGGFPEGVAVDNASVWVANRGANDVWRFSPSTNQRIDAIAVSPQPAAIATGGGAVWVADAGFDAVTRIDPLSRSTVTILGVGHHPSAIAYGIGSVWVTSRDDGTISRIDPATNRVEARIEVGNDPEGIVVDDNVVWVAVQGR
jgi:YVTN family beta-propeller protein